jgi:hypothetical protein
VYVLRSLFHPIRPVFLNIWYSFTVQGSPNEALALTNCLIVHPADFKDGEHVLVKGEFALTVR